MSETQATGARGEHRVLVAILSAPQDRAILTLTGAMATLVEREAALA